MRPDPLPRPDDLYGTHWGQHFQVTPTEPRPLTPAELARLARLGFHELALDLAAGTCDQCGLNKRSGLHRASCEKPVPVEPAVPIRQPWEPRAPRKRAA